MVSWFCFARSTNLDIIVWNLKKQTHVMTQHTQINVNNFILKIQHTDLTTLHKGERRPALASQNHLVCCNCLVTCFYKVWWVKVEKKHFLGYQQHKRAILACTHIVTYTTMCYLSYPVTFF